MQRFDGVCRLVHLSGQTADLPDCIAHHPITLASLLVSLPRRGRSLFSVARDLLHRRRHLVHRSRHLLGLDTLGLHTSAGLRGHCRKLVSRRGDLANAATDAPDQVTQAVGHVVHGVLQLADLIATRARLGMGQVASSNALSLLDGAAKRADDHSRNDRGGQQADENGQRANHAEQHVAAAFLLLHSAAGISQSLVGSCDYHFGLLSHRLFEREAFATILTKLVERQLVLVQLGQGLVHGSLLVIVQPDLQIAADGGHVPVQVAPALCRFIRAVGNVDILQGTHVQNLLGQPRGRLGHRQRIAALEAITFQAQHAHGVVHVQLDEFELFTADLSSLLHARAQLHATLDQRHVTVELPAVLFCSLLNTCQVGPLLRT